MLGIGWKVYQQRVPTTLGPFASDATTPTMIGT
jgi:hypothetical protein